MTEQWREALDVAQAVWPVVALVGQAGVVLILFWLRKHFVTRTAFTAHADDVAVKLEEHDARIVSLEQSLSNVANALGNLPQRDDLLPLQYGIREMRGDLKEVSARMKGTSDLVARLETQTMMLNEHLLNRGK